MLVLLNTFFGILGWYAAGRLTLSLRASDYWERLVDISMDNPDADDLRKRWGDFQARIVARRSLEIAVVIFWPVALLGIFRWKF